MITFLMFYITGGLILTIFLSIMIKNHLEYAYLLKKSKISLPFLYTISFLFWPIVILETLLSKDS